MPQISDQELSRMKQSLDELATLNRIASAINVSMSVDKITKTIVDHCCKRVNASQGAIFLLQDTEQSAEDFKTFVRDTSDAAGGIPFHLNQSLQGWMIKNKSIFLSNNPRTDERIRGVDYDKIGLHSILAAPLLSRKGLIGILVLFNKTDGNGFEDRDKRFIGIVGTQVSKVIENAQLFEREQKLAEFEKELGVARNIQKGFLPSSNAVTESFSIVGFSNAAKAVGGDYYDIIELDDTHTFFSLGDVSGKGLPAALLTGNAQAVVRSQLLSGKHVDLSVLADCLNRLIAHFTSPDQYITAVFGIYNHVNGKVSFVNAGHLPPMVVRRNGTLEETGLGGLVIGVLPGTEFSVLETELQPEDALYIYTDGVTEAFNEQKEQYGEERLNAFFESHSSVPVDAVIDKLQREIKQHRGKAEQSDDITVLGIGRIL